MRRGINTPAIKHDKGRHAGLDPASSLFLDSGFRRNENFAPYYCRINKKIAFFFVTVFLLLSFPAAQAATKTFTEEYTYPAGRMDNRTSARALALEGVKEHLWKSLWGFLEGLTEVRNLQLTAEQIPAFVPILAPVRVTDERWHDRTCRIRAELSVTSEAAVQTLRTLGRDLVRTMELTKIRVQREHLLEKMAPRNKPAPQKYPSLVRKLGALDWLLRGYIAENSGNRLEAKQAFDNALKLDRKNSDAFHHRGLALLRAGEKNGAIRDFTQAVTLNPGDDRAYYMRGLAFARENKDREAIRDFSRAIKINDRFFQAYVQRGLALDRSGKAPDALKDLTRAIELNPGDPRAYLNRGAVHSKLGHEQEAKDDFTKALRIDQRKALSDVRSDASPVTSGNDLHSLKDLDLVLSRDPGNAEAYFRRGILHDSMGNYQQAIQDLNKSIELDPRNAAAYFMRGLVYGIIDIQADSINDLKVSARLGYKPAQDYMSAKGMKW